ncbi:HAD hydrolase family protein [Longirhabdus pacifica]|uniref:HAD hydrolase family protein n=1 Tax=Longirhabdus pacifica TaxID=2305227 RepID=UPI001008E77B|nr:HAD hydrolase family protein [Longirhabdus pacifica]
MRLVIDLDGTICELKQPGQTYAEVRPRKGAVEALKQLSQDGHHLIIYTARHMRTCEGNVGKVVAKVGTITLEWLAAHEVPYDEIVFGKPYGDVYIDDLAVTCDTWEHVLQQLDPIAKSKQK